MAGELLVISHTGGLLLLPQPLLQGSVLELMFRTHRGPIMGTVKMLMPVSGREQPFRFLALPEVDQRTLQTAFQSRLYRNVDEEERIEELRAAVARWKPAPVRRHIVPKLVLALVALAACVVCAFYAHLLPRWKAEANLHGFSSVVIQGRRSFARSK
jgi:hypothetical protein